jgi:hypothetical protein
MDVVAWPFDPDQTCLSAPRFASLMCVAVWAGA